MNNVCYGFMRRYLIQELLKISCHRVGNVCSSAIVRQSCPVGWEIGTMVDDILTLQKDFVNCKF